MHQVSFTLSQDLVIKKISIHCARKASLYILFSTFLKNLFMNWKTPGALANRNSRTAEHLHLRSYLMSMAPSHCKSLMSRSRFTKWDGEIQLSHWLLPVLLTGQNNSGRRGLLASSARASQPSWISSFQEQGIPGARLKLCFRLKMLLRALPESNELCQDTAGPLRPDWIWSQCLWQGAVTLLEHRTWDEHGLTCQEKPCQEHNVEHILLKFEPVSFPCLQL